MYVCMYVCVCVYVCMYVCIDSSARRPNHTEFEKTTKFDNAMARLGAVREVSEERQRSVREASEARPGGVRGASGSCPKDVQIVFQRPSWQNRARALKKSGDSARSCLTFSVRTAKLPSFFDDFRGGAFSTAGAMDFYDFAKPQRLCGKLKIAAPVHKNCTGHCEHVLRT